jgi:hypothetical protein
MHATDASGINVTQMSCDLVHWRDAGTDNGDWGWGWGNGDAGCDPTDGLKTIYVRWRDRWGTWGGASDSIVLDWNAPSGAVVVEDGAPFTEDETITVEAGAVDEGSGVDAMALSNDGTTWTETPYAPVVDWSLGSSGVVTTPISSSTIPDGVKTVHVKWRDANGHWSSPKVDTIILDRAAPAGTIAIDEGAGYTKSTSVTVSTLATDAGTGVSLVALSNDGVHWTTRGYAASQPWTLTGTDGTRTVFVQWGDGGGHWSTVLSDTIVVDQGAPVAGPVRTSPVSGSTISAGRLLTRLSWNGTDSTSGIAHYHLQQSIDGGAWSTVSTTLTGPTIDRLLAVQHTYAFRVRAVDLAGNVGSWTASSARRLTRYSETSGSIRYSGPWAQSTSSVFWNGGAKVSSTVGAKATFTFTGRSVAFVSRLGPTRGRAKVYVDGTLVATVDLFAASYQNQRVAWSRSFASSGRHTVVVKVLGTTGRPRVNIDAFVVGT